MTKSRSVLFPVPAPRTVLLIVACLVGVARPMLSQGNRSGAATPAAPIDVPKLQYTRFVLPNGLTAILHEDHSSPIVAVELSYHAGSKNDVAGKTGLAHLFEHMLDEGSANLPNGEHRRIIQEAGGTYNAATADDRTRYPSRVPSNQLETLLWLEAERMAFMAPTLDSTRFTLEREAARNEYRANYLSRPAAFPGNLGGEAFFGTMFANTAYQNPVIGRMADLGNSTVADLRAFYSKYYVPNNAVIVLAGDFSSPVAKRWIERYFGGVPRGAAVQQPAGAIAPLTSELRVVLEDKVAPTQQLWIGWRGVPTANADRMPLTALAAILNARLQRLLVGERRLASGISPVSNNYDLELAGIFQTVVTATGSLTEIERLVDSVVTAVQDNGVTDVEVRRWAASFSTTSLTQLQAVSVKAEKLADSETIQGNAGAVFTDVERARKLTPQDVRRVATKYLVPQRVVMSIVPAGKLDLISKPAAPYVNVTGK